MDELKDGAPAEPIVFTLSQVAEKLQLPYDLVRDAVYAGKWPHTAFSPRNRRMSQDDIDKVVAMLHHEPVTQTTSEAHQRSRHVRDLLHAIET